MYMILTLDSRSLKMTVHPRKDTLARSNKRGRVQEREDSYCIIFLSLNTVRFTQREPTDQYIRVQMTSQFQKKNYPAVKIHPGKLEGRPAMICAKREELTSFLMYDITYFDTKKAEYRCIFKGGFQKKNYPAVKIHPGKFEDGPGKKRHLAT